MPSSLQVAKGKIGENWLNLAEKTPAENEPTYKGMSHHIFLAQITPIVIQSSIGFGITDIRIIESKVEQTMDE